jgi:hypothetical protein
MAFCKMLWPALLRDKIAAKFRLQGDRPGSRGMALSAATEPVALQPEL